MKLVLLLVMATIAASSARFLSYNEKKEVFNVFNNLRRAGENLVKKSQNGEEEEKELEPESPTFVLQKTKTKVETFKRPDAIEPNVVEELPVLPVKDLPLPVPVKELPPIKLFVPVTFAPPKIQKLSLPPLKELKPMTFPPGVTPKTFDLQAEGITPRTFALPEGITPETISLAPPEDVYMAKKRGLAEEKKDNFEEKVLGKLNSINQGVEGLMVAPLMNQIVDTMDNLKGVCDHTLMFLHSYLEDEIKDDESTEDASPAQEEESQSQEEEASQAQEEEASQAQEEEEQEKETGTEPPAQEEQTAEKRALLKRLLNILKEQSMKKRSSTSIRTKRNAWWAVNWDLVVDVCKTYYETSYGFSF